MKKNEIIELNGEQYTLELNRDSFIQIDKICNIDKSMAIVKRGFYEYEEEIDDNYNPLENIVSDEEIEQEMEIKHKTLKKLVENAFFIWLYPNHKLPISKVRELINPYFESDDESKIDWLSEKLGYYLQESVAIRQQYNKEQKNLKALANK